MVISYEIYEMTTSVRFCLSYDSFKWYFIALTMIIISTRKRIVDTDVVNNVTCYYTCGDTIFMTRRYPLNNSDDI